MALAITSGDETEIFSAAGTDSVSSISQTTGPEHPHSPSPTVNMVIRQDPFYITLDAWALLAISVLLIIGMRFIEHLLLEFMIVTVPLLLLVRNDYQNFLKLGPGGTEPTPAGYARLTWYRLFSLRDPFRPPPRNPMVQPAAGILGRKPLPYRAGPRPKVAGLAPQRQLDQHGSWHEYDCLEKTLEGLAARMPQKFVTATSCLEKHGFALFSRQPLNVCGNGEIAHIHQSDRSLHMNLHPDDIKEVLKKGWGERHPMAWSGWVYTPIPTTFVMIYAPRNEDDMRIVCRIIEASVWYVNAEEAEIVPVRDL